MKATSTEGSGASRTTSRRNASTWPGGCPSFLCRTVRAVSRLPKRLCWIALHRSAPHLIRHSLLLQSGQWTGGGTVPTANAVAVRGALATKGTRGRSGRTDNDRSRMVMAKDPPEPKRDGKGAHISGSRKPAREVQEPFTIRPPETDHGSMPNLKWSFADSHVRIEKSGWTRETTIRELPIAKDVSGVNMRLEAGGV
ncbi:hypothetical protein ACVWZM_005620 [Bradyrhizobium sp. USDA 4501]